MHFSAVVWKDSGEDFAIHRPVRVSVKQIVTSKFDSLAPTVSMPINEHADIRFCLLA